mgnify:FL=1
MGEKKRKQARKQKNLFSKKNYQWMFFGLLFISLGFIIMSGGGSDDPNVFKDAIFSTKRIRLAPTLILVGFVIEVYAILLNPKK